MQILLGNICLEVIGYYTQLEVVLVVLEEVARYYKVTAEYYESRN